MRVEVVNTDQIKLIPVDQADRAILDRWAKTPHRVPRFASSALVDGKTEAVTMTWHGHEAGGHWRGTTESALESAATDPCLSACDERPQSHGPCLGCYARSIGFPRAADKGVGCQVCVDRDGPQAGCMACFLTGANEELRTKLAEIRVDRNDIVEKLVKARDSLDLAREHIDRLSEEKRKLEDVNRGLAAKLSYERSRCEHDLDQLRGNLDASAQAREEAHAERGDLMQQLVAARDELERARADLTTERGLGKEAARRIGDELNATRDEKASAVDDLRAARIATDAVEGSLRAVRAQLAGARSNAEEATAALKAEQDGQAEFRAVLAKRDAEISEAHGERDRAVVGETDAVNALREARDELDRLNRLGLERSVGFNAELEGLREELKADQETARQMAGKLNAANAGADVLKGRITGLSDRCAELTSERDRALKEAHVRTLSDCPECVERAKGLQRSPGCLVCFWVKNLRAANESMSKSLTAARDDLKERDDLRAGAALDREHIGRLSANGIEVREVLSEVRAELQAEQDAARQLSGKLAEATRSNESAAAIATGLRDELKAARIERDERVGRVGFLEANCVFQTKRANAAEDERELDPEALQSYRDRFARTADDEAPADTLGQVCEAAAAKLPEPARFCQGCGQGAATPDLDVDRPGGPCTDPFHYTGPPPIPPVNPVTGRRDGLYIDPGWVTGEAGIRQPSEQPADLVSSEDSTGAVRVEGQIRAVADELARMLIDKNRAYGNSALAPRRVFSTADTLEQLAVRMDDKISRIANAEGAYDEDARLDLMGYLMLDRIKRQDPEPVGPPRRMEGCRGCGHHIAKGRVWCDTCRKQRTGRPADDFADDEASEPGVPCPTCSPGTVCQDCRSSSCVKCGNNHPAPDLYYPGSGQCKYCQADRDRIVAEAQARARHDRAGEEPERRLARGETVLTELDLDDLPEYSSSLPTGTTAGKRWKRRTRGGDWLVGEYVKRADQIGIDWAWAVAAPGSPHRAPDRKRAEGGNE